VMSRSRHSSRLNFGSPSSCSRNSRESLPVKSSMGEKVRNNSLKPSVRNLSYELVWISIRLGRSVGGVSRPNRPVKTNWPLPDAMERNHLSPAKQGGLCREVDYQQCRARAYLKRIRDGENISVGAGRGRRQKAPQASPRCRCERLSPRIDDFPITIWAQSQLRMAQKIRIRHKTVGVNCGIGLCMTSESLATDGREPRGHHPEAARAAGCGRP